LKSTKLRKITRFKKSGRKNEFQALMNNDFTFSIIKPEAVRAGKTGHILAMISDAGFVIAALRMVHLTVGQAEDFYAVHRERPFYRALVEFMSSGPVVVMVLRHGDAVEEFRKLIGSTDPAKAEKGTVRALYGTSVQMNAVHGSDSDENAKREAGFFFSAAEIF
jgi:nucleoside-diphosphate kinase